MELPAETYLRLAHKQLNDLKPSLWGVMSDPSFHLEELQHAAVNIKKARDLDPSATFIEYPDTHNCDTLAIRVMEAEIAIRESCADYCERSNGRDGIYIHPLSAIRAHRLAALEIHEKLVAYKPEAQIYYVLASRYEQLGEGSKAREAIRKGLELDPTDISLLEASQKWDLDKEPTPLRDFATDHYLAIWGLQNFSYIPAFGGFFLWSLIRPPSSWEVPVGWVSFAGFALLATTAFLRSIARQRPL